MKYKVGWVEKLRPLEPTWPGCISFLSKVRKDNRSLPELLSHDLFEEFVIIE
jgi:hypothetical protein